MNIKDQERSKFEQWLKAQPHVLNVGFNKTTQKYVLSEDQDQWIGWQARAELSLKAEARIEELEEMLKWYVEEDEIHEGDPENQYWVDGKYKAMKLLGMEIEE